ncbi:hypothetical protein DID78_02780 [Candidatus Marinamargulisbacteria bacterium SCGC AG-343-D04]|nr:hypothetical protein DID78_02780 [Candidatus Marinamargulisbacteria bacterium SCGC AG-343-D04]
MASVINEIKDFFGFAENSASENPDVDTSLNIKPFKGSLINSNNARPFASSEIKINEPRVYEDSLNIAAHLRENKPVIVNLKYLDKQSGKRLIDFICGTAYAINGHMMKIGENIFLFTPANILIANTNEKTTLEQGIENSEKDIFFNKISTG